jgi:hypothetical protein
VCDTTIGTNINIFAIGKASEHAWFLYVVDENGTKRAGRQETKT